MHRQIYYVLPSPRHHSLLQFRSHNFKQEVKTLSNPIATIMSNIKKAELVIIPGPGIGHLVPMVEIAKRLVERDSCLSLTILIMKLPLDSKLDDYVDSLPSSLGTTRIQVVQLSNDNVFTDTTNPNFVPLFMNSYMPHVRDTVRKLVESDSPRVAGLMFDMFCASMIDVADEFCLPSYLYFTSAAAFLGLLFYVEKKYFEEGMVVSECKDNPDAELDFPCFAKPLPAKLLPVGLLSKESVSMFIELARRYKETKGIVVNTFMELESSVVKTLMDANEYPPLYSVGPLLNLKNHINPMIVGSRTEIMEWLDGQPDSSVVFLCFGSMGSFRHEQVREIACALEQSGHRFLWSLRKSPPMGKREVPSDYNDFQGVLPEGFLDRMAGKGKVIGWAPQVDILAHPAVGGFVSHCGWNSILESLWFGVPMATWPLYAEQQFNAFLLVMELGLGVEIKIDYRNEFRMQTEQVVKAGQIESGIRSLMEVESGRRKKVKEISEMSHLALMEGGSSYINLGFFVDNVFKNIPEYGRADVANT